MLVQRFPTYQACDVEAFLINGIPYIFFADRYADGMHNEDEDNEDLSSIWKLDLPSDTFVKTQSIETHRPYDLEAFEMAQETYVFVANSIISKVNIIDGATNMRTGPAEASFLLSKD